MSTRSVGDLAERRVALFLEEQYGYKILHRNYACRLGEIDLIAEEAGVLCFIEVRSRTSSRYGEALETISATKRRRIALTARHYLVTRGHEERACRFDVVTVQNGREPVLLRDAFHLGEGE